MLSWLQSFAPLGCANGGTPLRDSSSVIQTCSEKSGGCPSTHECHAVSLGPDTVSHRCCPTKGEVSFTTAKWCFGCNQCSSLHLRPSSAAGILAMLRGRLQRHSVRSPSLHQISITHTRKGSSYYFNIVTKKCSPFAFNGCDGNPNNFASLTQCNNFCTSSGKRFAGLCSRMIF